MTEPLMRWLRDRELDGYAEVIPPLWLRSIDLLGWNGRATLVAIEMKTSLQHSLIAQCNQCFAITDTVYCAVTSYPIKSSIKKCHAHGIGILCVHGDSVTEILPPLSTLGNKNHASYHLDAEKMEKLFDYMRKCGPGGNAGIPTLKGKGPARDVRERIVAYRKENPDASWKELFSSVANHYASAKSMQQAQVKLEEWMALRGEITP